MQVVIVAERIDAVHDARVAHRGDLHTLLDAFKSGTRHITRCPLESELIVPLAGVPVDIRDKFYKTPLMIAAANGDLDTTTFLLECGYVKYRDIDDTRGFAPGPMCIWRMISNGRHCIMLVMWVN